MYLYIYEYIQSLIYLYIPPLHSSLIAKNQTRSINYSKRVDCLGNIITRKLIRNATPAAIRIVPQMTNKVCHVPRTTQKQINFHLLKQQSRLIGKTFAPTFRLSRKDLCTFDRKDCKKKLWGGGVTGYSSWWQHECYFRVHFESHKPHAGHFSFAI